MWSGKITRSREKAFGLPFVIIAIMLLSGVGVGALIPSLMLRLSSAAGTIEGSIVVFGTAFWGLVIGTLIIAVLIIFRQDEVAANAVIAASIVLDWYLHIGFVALLIALVLLLVFFLGRSSRYPWVQPRALWLWFLFLVLFIFAAIRGSLSTYETLYYYNYISFGAFIMFWLGTVIARNVTSARRFFKVLAGFGTLIAIHAIIQAITGIFLFWSPLNNNYYASLSNFILIPGLDTQRIGSFLLNPDWAGPFFAFVLFIALGLFVESKTLPEKFLYLFEVFLMVVALLFTYTYGAIIGAGIGVIFLIALIGRMSYRILLSVTLSLFAVAVVVFFSYQLYLLQLRPEDSLIRFGAWQTALRIIGTFPLTGIGLGLNNYLVRADPYRVPAQYIPLGHPLNSYLELAANGGLPLLLVFIALLMLAMWLTLRNWKRADIQTRALLAGCIAAVISLSIDSLTSNIWTNPPLATLGWLVLGVTSSPLLLRRE